jgi:hypothetical protein
MAVEQDKDGRYRECLLEPIRICANYRPKFGGAGTDEKEFTVQDFQALFGADPLYSWLGLNSPLMYAAHKAAGGMTSIYRQLGIGCERLFRAIVQDQFGLTDEQVRWGFEVTSGDDDAKVQRITLDARIDLDHVRDKVAAERVKEWLVRVEDYIKLGQTRRLINGAVFEVRQGYKSADSKRQNADLRFGLRAYDEAYLPVVLVFSHQVSQTVAKRYRDSKLLVLTGTVAKDDRISTFAFCENIVGYSLVHFFERNTLILKRETTKILEALLSPSS